LKLCAAKHNFKSYVIDGTLLRTGSANWSPTGLKRQDNDVHYEVDTKLAALFEARFEAMWDRPTNQMATTPAQ
jgi:phosphatidylserine/phosphatidylglycerophosphate/cardiolipin synthase-like enzyme